MKAVRLFIEDFRQFENCEVVIGNKLTAIAGNNGTGKSTILGLLANSSEPRGKKTYIGKSFRGEFAELFSGSPGQDPTGRKIRLDYVERGREKSVDFRTAWQNNGTRFRVIPKRKLPDGKITEAKLMSPVVYLGLSRLYPFGEAPSRSLKRYNQQWDSDEDYDWFVDKYKEILSIRSTTIESVSSFDIANSRKRGTGVKTGNYGPAANSAGQDNLGQILMAVLSFKRLKRELADDWDGGLLLIDEVDATLHPAAQRRLVDLLLKESGKYGFQVVFTTHSTVVLEYLVDKAGFAAGEAPSDIEIAYLTDANRKLEVKRSPSWHTMTNDLFVRGPGGSAPRVGVFSEDDEARWLIGEIIEALNPALMSRIDFIEASFGCDTLIQLYEHDYPYMKDRIIVFDGDVTDEQIGKISKRYLKEAKNIVRLPGTVRPEQLIWDFLSNAEESDPVWESLGRYEYTYRSIVENGPLTSAYAQYGTERNKYKAWLKDCEDDFRRAGVVECWVATNLSIAWDFVEAFTEAYSRVARTTSAAPAPMAKRPNGV